MQIFRLRHKKAIYGRQIFERYHNLSTSRGACKIFQKGEGGETKIKKFSACMDHGVLG